MRYAMSERERKRRRVRRVFTLPLIAAADAVSMPPPTLSERRLCLRAIRGYATLEPALRHAPLRH